MSIPRLPDKEPPHVNPTELDRQLRTVIARLELVSSAATCNYNPDGAGESSGLPVGDRNPPHERYRRRLAGVDRGLQRRLDAAEAEGDRDQRAALERKAHAWRHETRTGILKAAETELEAMTGRDGKAPKSRKAMMDTDAGMRRVVEAEAPGKPADAVAAKLGLSVFIVRRIYLAMERDTVNGERLPTPKHERTAKVAELMQKGLTSRQIATLTGMHQTQVIREMRRAA